MEPQDMSGMALSEQPCKYCKPAGAEEDGDHFSQCPYCQIIEANAVGDECPYCVAMNQEDSKCQYCVEMTNGPDTVLPTTTDSQNYAGQDLNSPELDKPVMGEDGPVGLGVSTPDVISNNNAALDPQAPSVAALDPNAAGPKEMVQVDQSKEAMMAIAQAIENDATTDAEQAEISAAAPVANQIDATQEAVGTDMDGNVSRPAGYATNTPGDMGTGQSGEVGQEDAPDLTDVLQGGLEAQSDNIQRERVVQMCGQALEGFKASKDILERAQTQAPQLYQSSIMMLKAMIEMAKMLGLDAQGAPASQGNPLEEQAPQAAANPHGTAHGGESADQWKNPFPTHPDQGGLMMPGHAKPSKSNDESRIGQGVGKLPTSATTEHVARTPQSEGSVNDKGQKKVIDPATGDVRWINMREGRVQSPNGIPVKPEQG